MNVKNSIRIIHSEPLFTIVDKPTGLLAVPGRGQDKQDCVVRRVKSMFPDCIAQPAVHRLDMDTSGLMIIARTKESHRDLSKQFAEHAVKKRYIAVLDGHIEGNSGTVELSFRLDPLNRPHQVYDPLHGKLGTTTWSKLAVEGERTRVEFKPLTGRTHQLRLHASHQLGLDCPIVGDRLYGTRRGNERMLLHAAGLTFRHPAKETVVHFESEVPF